MVIKGAGVNVSISFFFFFLFLCGGDKSIIVCVSIRTPRNGVLLLILISCVTKKMGPKTDLHHYSILLYIYDHWDYKSIFRKVLELILSGGRVGWW